MIKAIAIRKITMDERTGAPVTHFVPTQYIVNLREYENSQVVLQGFVSQATFEQGRDALQHIAVDITSRPEGADVLEWLLQQAVAREDSPMFGGEVVYQSDDVPDGAPAIVTTPL